MNKYTMWVREVEGVTIPVHYEMRGYNSLLGSHYDHYFLTYENFSEEVSFLFILFINNSFSNNFCDRSVMVVLKLKYIVVSVRS